MATPKGQRRTSPEGRRYSYIQSIRGRREASESRKADLSNLGYSTGQMIGAGLRKRSSRARRAKAGGSKPRWGV